MKYLLLFFTLFICLTSCKKVKERKELEKLYGFYDAQNTSANHVIYSDSTRTLDVKTIELHSGGMALTGASGTAVSFKVMSKSENNNSSADYLVEYSSITNWSFASGSPSNDFLAKETFNQGRRFFIKFDGNMMHFMICNQDLSIIDSWLFTKRS